MSRKIIKQYPDQGMIADPTLGITFDFGTTVPTDTTAGYAPGCIFLDTDGSAGVNVYQNVGTGSSCDFNKISAVDLSGLTATVAELNAVNTGNTATAAEINMSSDVSTMDEVVTTTNVITAAESGRTFYLNLAGGFTSTLPAPAIGLKFRFVVKTAPTTSYVITTNGGSNIIYGKFVERAGGAGVAGAAQDTVNLVANQAIISDFAEFWSDGTNWYVHGMVDVIAGATFAVT